MDAIIKKELNMERKRCISNLASFMTLVLVVLALAGCSSGSSADPSALKDTSTSPSQIVGIYSGTYDGQAADFICTGTDCLITVAGKTYAKGVFTNLQSASASVRAASFSANLQITDKINGDGLLCPIATPVTIYLVFPPEGSADPIKMTVNGVTTDLTEVVTYVVTFDRQNNEKALLPVKAGTSLNLSDPIFNDIAKGNYSLMDWCLDAACTQPAPNPLTVDKDITLFAKWAMTILAAPTVTNVSDGISISVDSTPDETNGFQLFRVEADGSWTSLYYRGSWETGYKTTPILYPFVERGKTCRYVLQFYGLDSLTKAVSEIFTVTPVNGVGEISVSNGDALTLQITDDGKFSMGAVPVFSGAGAASITGSKGSFEFWKGNGFASEASTYINGTDMKTADITAQHDLFQYLLTNTSIPLSSSSKFFVHFVLNAQYGGYNYRVFERESEVRTLIYDARWRAYSADTACVYTNEKTAMGAKITVMSDPDRDGVKLMYFCDAAQGKSCTFTITIKNNSSEEELVTPTVYGNNIMVQSNGLSIPAGETKTITINDVDRVVTINPLLRITVTGGSFEITNPTVTEN